jgi:gliding motility-associated-like protein
VFKFDFLIETIVADFTAPPPGCTPFNASFINTSLSQSNTTYYWEFGDGASSTDENPSHTYTQAGFYDVMLIVSDPSSCNLVDTMIKQIFVLADTSYKLSDITICEQNNLQIGITPSNDPDITYSWTPGSTLSDSTVANPIASPTQTTTYTLLISNGTCTDTLYQTVNVNSILDPSLLNVYADDDTIIVGGSTQLHVEPSTAYVYLWSPSNGLSSVNVSNPFASPSVTTTYVVSIQDSSSSDCGLTDSVKVVVLEFNCDDPYIFVPSAFSPNDDGYNDILFVRGNFLESLFFTLYNRWGEEVFSTTDQNIGWDGKYKGMLVDPAVFVFYLEAKCIDGQEYFEKGNITLMR